MINQEKQLVKSQAQLDQMWQEAQTWIEENDVEGSIELINVLTEKSSENLVKWMLQESKVADIISNLAFMALQQAIHNNIMKLHKGK